MKTIAIVGYGNLATSIFKGFATNPKISQYDFFVHGRHLDKAQEFANKFPKLKIQAIETLEILKDCNPIIILCVKPKGLSYFTFYHQAYLIYSVMAGVEIAQIKQYFQNASFYARAMPNVGASAGHSSTAVFLQHQNQDTQEATQILQNLTDSFGATIFLNDEMLIDSSIATSGSTPAFLSLVAEGLIDAGVREGIDHATSVKLVQNTFEGFAKLLKTHTPQEIKTLVTSPAGTTAQGLAYLESKAFKGIIQEAGHQAVLKAQKKTH
ncbi:hypothetical protein BBW65_03000 [Helicobacter enhydrae]|uniref:Pyrroline-5-carboxylate reductase n=1 Tax=Helicobacter enhydrae TaxID=222136 RepID=A0A1B1U554_9HELI|nr:pyrroline-5-carboxylate reductase dimerization domain-containing protein [Helicobacter enhydrae]ANV97832.1 hypothetical protein BBW65_03000 [Helicobacter enhydrae]